MTPGFHTTKQGIKRKVWMKPYISRNLTLGTCAFICCRWNVSEISTILNFLSLWIEKLHVRLHIRLPFCEVSHKSPEQSACFDWLTVNNTHLPTVHVLNTKKLVKKLARIETSSIWHQQVANVFLCYSHTPTWVCQHEFANFSLLCEGCLSAFVCS